MTPIRRQSAAQWTALPPHVWALVLSNATLHALHCVAHACRALHELITSSRTCTCSTNMVPQSHHELHSPFPTQFFWTHLRDVCPRPSTFEFFASIERGHVAHARLALRWGTDPSDDDQAAIRAASQCGHCAVVELLLRDERVDPAAHAQYALFEACAHGHVAVVERLLREPRIDPRAHGQNAFVAACRNGHLDVVVCLLRDGRIDPGAWGQEAIERASR